MAEWLKGCEICNAGLCARFEELIGQGMSQRRAAKELEKDQREQLGEVVYPWDALRARFKRQKVGTIRPSPAIETCAVSDLQNLLGTGRKFGTIYADPPWPYSNQATRASSEQANPRVDAHLDN
jgi:hypothetical protein